MGGARQQGVVLLLLTVLRWMEPKVTSSNAFPSTQNKPGMSRELQELQDLEIPSLFLVVSVTRRSFGDGIWPDLFGSEQDRPAAAAIGSTHSVASRRRPDAVLPPTFMAEGRPLRALAPAICRCYLYYFLQARVPEGKIFLSTVKASITCTVPSGFVLGDGVGGHGGELFVNIGGEGLDGVSSFLFRVLLEKLEGACVIFLFLQPLCVICNPTALN
jgi:hypothetical protein